MIFGGALFVLIGWLWFKALMLTVVFLGLVGWALTKMIVHVPEGTAVVVGRRVIFNYQDHALDADGNVIDSPGTRYDAWHFIGLPGLLGQINKSRVVFANETGKLHSKKTIAIPLRGLGMEIPVRGITRDGKTVDAVFAVRVRVTNPLAVATNWDWAQKARNALWSHARATVGRRNFSNLCGAGGQICSYVLERAQIEHIVLEELALISFQERKT